MARSLLDMSHVKRRNDRGFTLLELMVTVAILGILTALAVNGVSKMRPRLDLGSKVNEFVSVLYMAKSRAMATNSNVIVIISRNVTGKEDRYFVYQDTDYDFFTTGGVNYANFDPDAPDVEVADGDYLLESASFGGSVVIGPSTGWGPDLERPFSNIDVPADPCSFCGTNRGHIVFRADGTAEFYDDTNTPSGDLGAVLVFYAPKVPDELRLAVVVTAQSGIIKTFRN